MLAIAALWILHGVPMRLAVGQNRFEMPTNVDPTALVGDDDMPVVPAMATSTGGVSVTSLKPAVSKREMSRTPGLTEVPLDRKLDFILQGGEPKSVQDLMLLQKQQTAVADKIKAVTVHIEQGSAQGSGVIITGDGYVLTAAHVAGKPNRDAWIRMPDGKRVRGRTLGMNRYMDAGLVKITDSRSEKQEVQGQLVEKTVPWPHATLGTSAQIQPGHWVIATGHPGGWNKERNAVVRVGRVVETMQSTLVTDCALIGGDSGGPLFDLQGKLVGIHSRIGTDVGDNMHVPIDVFADSWDRMARNEAWGTLPGYKPRIGVSGSETNPEAIITEIVPESPAAQAGIRVGDIIRKFDGTSIRSFQELKNAVDASLPGDRVRVDVERAGKVLELRLVIGVEE